MRNEVGKDAQTLFSQTGTLVRRSWQSFQKQRVSLHFAHDCLVKRERGRSPGLSSMRAVPSRKKARTRDNLCFFAGEHSSLPFSLVPCRWGSPQEDESNSHTC